jgi:hypothetical protein
VNVLIAVSLVVCVWALWLARLPFAARWMRAAAVLVAASMVGVSAYWFLKLQVVFASLSAASSNAERQRVLSEGLARAYTVLLIGGAAVFVAWGVLSVLVRSRQPRARDEGREPIGDQGPGSGG